MVRFEQATVFFANELTIENSLFVHNMKLTVIKESSQNIGQSSFDESDLKVRCQNFNRNEVNCGSFNLPNTMNEFFFLELSVNRLCNYTIFVSFFNSGPQQTYHLSIQNGGCTGFEIYGKEKSFYIYNKYGNGQFIVDLFMPR